MRFVLVTTRSVAASTSETKQESVGVVNQPQSLRDLVERAARRHDTSGRQLAFLAQKQGFTLAVTTVNHLKAGTYKYTPSEETIRAIAWLAGVSDEVAFTAAGQPVPGPPFADELPPGVDHLPPKARKAAIEMLRVLVDLNKDAQHRDQDTSTTDTGSSVMPSAPNASGQSGKRHEASDELELQRAARRRPRKEQKTNQPADPPAQEDDGALPPNWRELAAYKGPTSHLEREAYFDELGEEPQETPDGN